MRLPATLLIGLSLVTSGCQSKQDKAVEAIEKLGGFCKTADNRPDSPVVTVYLYNRQTTDRALAYLHALPGVEILDLKDAHVPDQALVRLEKLSRIRGL